MTPASRSREAPRQGFGKANGGTMANCLGEPGAPGNKSCSKRYQLPVGGLFRANRYPLEDNVAIPSVGKWDVVQWAMGSHDEHLRWLHGLASRQWAMGNGQWAMGSRQWAVGSGQCWNLGEQDLAESDSDGLQPPPFINYFGRFFGVIY